MRQNFKRLGIAGAIGSTDFSGRDFCFDVRNQGQLFKHNQNITPWPIAGPRHRQLQALQALWHGMGSLGGDRPTFNHLPQNLFGTVGPVEQLHQRSEVVPANQGLGRRIRMLDASFGIAYQQGHRKTGKNIRLLFGSHRWIAGLH